jgi:hypothetical protein
MGVGLMCGGGVHGDKIMGMRGGVDVWGRMGEWGGGEVNSKTFSASLGQLCKLLSK